MTVSSVAVAFHRIFLVIFLFLNQCQFGWSRPVVRSIRSTHEFDRLLEKHATQTGLPVILDFYSDGCGPCRQIAPYYTQLAKEVQDDAVFVKIDVNAQHELSSRYQVRSMPTFLTLYNGKIVDRMSGANGQQLQQYVQGVISKSRRENVLLSREALGEYYQQVDPSKASEAIDSVFQKCVDMNPKSKFNNPQTDCFGAAALTLTKKLKDKYKSKPTVVDRFSAEDRKPSDTPGTAKDSEPSSSTRTKPTASSGSAGGGASNKPNLHLASMEELKAELEKRLEEEEEARMEEEEDADEDEEFQHSYIPSDFPERVVIVGGGPAGMSAAIYAARAGLKPVVIAPPMGGQLQGKGVDVENYPGLFNVTGPAVISAMRTQAIEFGAVFEGEAVLSIDASTRPFKVNTNSSSVETHTVIVATGAESNWLNIPGEYEMRGGGVSSCATCDGAAFYGKDVLVVGGGDTAMEDALVLARTSKSVTVIHRRDEFRASKVLAQRVMDHPSISIAWNTIVEEIIGEDEVIETEDGGENSGDEDSVDLDNVQKIVTSATLKNVETREITKIACNAVFVAIGHTPTTSFLKDIVEFDPEHAGYIKTKLPSTHTSVPGIFAAGDVSDAIYRQAITSAGSGAAAALDAERYLSEEGLGNEEAEFEAELMAELMAEEDNNRRTVLASTEEPYNAYNDVGGRLQGMKESTKVEL